ncbi:MAG TPA: GNAT family N-acetyltransferase [Myxococcales bacterium]|nr:GNAT family N-acetyltransferase [Myxococcales bacterium]
MPIIVTTERLTLRSWTPDDAPALLKIYSDPLVTEFIPHVHLRDLPAAEAKVREMQKLEAANGCTLWAVERGGELIGVCGFRSMGGAGSAGDGRSADARSNEGELGFAFRRDTWGQGFAREAATACLQWADERGVRRIVAQTRPGNAGSRHVLDRLGFAHVGQNGEWLVYERLTAKTAL